MMKKNNSGIYSITFSNDENNKQYIGQAKHFQKRWNTHLWKLRKNRHDNQYLQNAFNKYSEENIIFSKIVSCDPDKSVLQKYEQIMMDSLLKNEKYNLAPSAYSMIGFKHTDNTKHKISFSKTNPSIESRLNMSNAQKGKIASAHTKEKMSKAQTGSKHHRATPVKCIETGLVFPTLTSAAKSISSLAVASHISRACQRLIQTAYGYHWEYI